MTEKAIVISAISAIYFVIISITAVIVTLADKRAAEKDKWRVQEKTLFIIAALGGAAAMLITMKRIRHKTLHKRFMIGLPAIIVLHFVLIIAVGLFNA